MGPVQGSAMLKSGNSNRARTQQRSLRRAELPAAVEGQIEEICRDLAVQAKRMRQLQEQADELRTVIRQWAEGAEAGSSPAD